MIVLPGTGLGFLFEIVAGKDRAGRFKAGNIAALVGQALDGHIHEDVDAIPVVQGAHSRRQFSRRLGRLQGRYEFL